MYGTRPSSKHFIICRMLQFSRTPQLRISARPSKVPAAADRFDENETFALMYMTCSSMCARLRARANLHLHRHLRTHTHKHTYTYKCTLIRTSV